jgi:hypothetical protein
MFEMRLYGCSFAVVDFSGPTKPSGTSRCHFRVNGGSDFVTCRSSQGLKFGRLIFLLRVVMSLSLVDEDRIMDRIVTVMVA